MDAYCKDPHNERTPNIPTATPGKWHSPGASECVAPFDVETNEGALIIRIEFWDMLYYTYNKEAPN